MSAVGPATASPESPGRKRKASWRDGRSAESQKLKYSAGRAGRGGLLINDDTSGTWDLKTGSDPTTPPGIGQKSKPTVSPVYSFKDSDGDSDSDFCEDSTENDIFQLDDSDMEINDDIFDHEDLEGIEEKITDDTNIIVSYQQLCLFVSNNFVCNKCRRKVEKLERTTVGLATRLSHGCACGKSDHIEPELVDKTADGNAKRTWQAYTLNLKLLMVTHLIGASYRAAFIFLGMLNLSSVDFHHSWKMMEDHLHGPIQELTDGIVRQNVCEELDGVLPDANGLFGMSTSGDGAWNQGKYTHNSVSGHQMMVGKVNEKVVAYSCFSKVCATCHVWSTKEKEAPTHMCPKNYEGSSKGMESFGLMKCLLELHHDHKVKIKIFVTDDDATTKAYMRHSYSELIEAGEMEAQDWPRTASSRKKDDKGKLPLTHP